MAGLLVTNVYKYIGLPRAVLCLIPATCLPGRLEPDVLRPYRHVLQRGGLRAPIHHTMTSCLYFITMGSDLVFARQDFVFARHRDHLPGADFVFALCSRGLCSTSDSRKFWGPGKIGSKSRILGLVKKSRWAKLLPFSEPLSSSWVSS